MKIIISIFFLLILMTINTQYQNIEKSSSKISQQIQANQFNSSIVNLVNGGLKRFFSSLTWVGTLLYIDYDHYKEDNFNNWIYKRLDYITDIDRPFKMAYIFGGEFLSVLKDDPRASNELLLKGLKTFPDDAWINYFLGYNSFHEFDDKKGAIPYFEHILKVAPSAELPVKADFILASLYQRIERKELAIKLLCAQFLKSKSLKIKKEYRLKILKINNRIKFNCNDS